MKHITSKLLSLLLTLAMFLSMVPAAYAVDDGSGEESAEEYAAFSGSTHWTTVQEAINEGPGNIYLEKDVTEEFTIPAGKTVNLSLYGHQLHGIVTNNGNLTIDQYKQYFAHPDIGGGDAIITNNGTLKLGCDGATGFIVQNNGTLNITSGATYTLSNITNGEAGVIEIIGGYFNGEPDTTWLRAGYIATLQSNGSYKVAADDVYAIEQGYVARTDLSSRVYYKTLQEAINSNQSTVNIITDVTEDCTKENGDIILNLLTNKFTGSLSCSGNITVQNGTTELESVTCENFTAKQPSWNNSTNVIIKNGSVGNVTVEKTAYYGISVEIKDGNYTGTVSAVDEDTLSISGGTFTGSDVTAYVADGYTYDPETGTVKPDTTEPTGVARIGNAYYETLEAAIKATKTGDTVTLLQNVDLGTSSIKFYNSGVENLTFDLGGHKITSAVENNGTVIASRTGLVIKNGTIENTSTGTKKATSAIYVTGGGTTTLENVTLVSNKSGLYVCQLSNAVSVTVDIGGQTATNAVYGVLIDAPTGTPSKIPSVTLNISGGTINGTSDGVKVNSPGGGKTGTVKTNITGGTVSSVNIISLSSTYPATLEISGGTVEGTLTCNGPSEITVKDGIFNGEVKMLGTNGTITISGGTFSTDVSAYVAEGYTYNATTGKVTPSTTEPAGVAEVGGTGYATLAEAIRAANTGDTVTLLDDITLTSAQSISKQLTLDLNGKTLSSTALWTIKLSNSATDLTVVDSSEEQSGKITNAYSGTSSADPIVIYFSSNGSGAKFTLKSGTLEACSTKNGFGPLVIGSKTKAPARTVNIEGGYISVPANSRNCAISVGAQMTLNISGGTIIGGLHGVDAYSGSTVNITGGTISARYIDTGLIKEAYGMRINGTADVTINGGEIQGIKMDDDGYNLDAPNVTLVSGNITGSFYSIANGTIVFTVDPTATITFINDSVSEFLPSTVELVKNEDATYGVTKATAYVAKIADKGQYETLEAAFAAAVDGDTITLLSNCSGNGIVVEESAFPSGLTVDFAGYTYTVSGRLVGSNNSETNGFQLKKGNKITFTNGTITSADTCTGKMSGNRVWTGAAAILLQNYCDLTLDGMTVTGGNATCYTMSNNNGKTFIKDSTIIAGKNTNNVSGPFAFDVCGFANYSGADVTVTGNSRIEGDIEISSDKAGNRDLKFTLESGMVTGSLVASSGAEKVTVTKSSDVTLAAPDGYEWDDNGTLVCTYAAAFNGIGYETLEAAIAAAKVDTTKARTVTLLNDCSGNGIMIEKDAFPNGLTVDFAGHTYTMNGTPVGSTGTETQAMHIEEGNKIILMSSAQNKGTFRADESIGSELMMLVQNYADLTVKNMNLDGSEVSLSGETFTLSSNNGTVVIDDSVLTPTAGNRTQVYAIGICGFASYAGTDVTITGNSQVNGKVRLIYDEAAVGTPQLGLKLESGSVKELIVNSSAKQFTVTKSAAFTVEKGTPTGYEWKDNGDGNLTLTPIAAVAKVNHHKGEFSSLEDALAAAADGDTIMLLDDISVSKQIVIDKKLTIMLSGKTLTSTYKMGSSGDSRYAIVTNAPVKIYGGNGTIKATQARAINAHENLTIYNYATVISEVTGGNACIGFAGANKTYTIMRSTIEGAYAVCNFADNATIVIENSTLVGTGNVLYHNGTYHGLDLTVTGTTINGDNAVECGVYIAGSTQTFKDGGLQKAYFKNCTISGTNGVEVKYTDLTLENCKVSTTVKEPSYTQNNNGPTGKGFAVVSTDNVMEANVTPKPVGTIKIIGSTGKYTGLVGLGALNSVKETYNDFSDDTIAVSGGTFSSEVMPEYCADGYVPKDNGDGTYGVEAYTPIEVWTGYTGTKVASYDTIAAAVENLGENKWIVVAKDYTLTDNFTIPEGVYLDVANGATLTVNDGVTLTVAADAKRLGVRTGATLVNNGTILVCGSNTTNGFAMLYGTFSGNALTVPEDCFLDNNGKNFFATAESDAVYEITFSDGSVKKTADSANIKGGNVTQIKLLGDVTKGGWTLDNSSVGPEVTLDLNGHTLSYDGANPYYATLNVYTKVTIKNGTVKYTGSKRGAIDLVGQGDLTIESDVVVDGGDAYGIFTSGTSKLTVNGTVKANGNYAIAGNGSETAGNIDSTDVTINDGAVVSAPKGLAIYHPQLGTVTVNGGEISGHTGIEMCAGKLVVNDGSITSTGDNWDTAGSQNAILDGAAISIINRNYPGGVPTAEINGGTIKATGNGAQTVKAYDYTNNAVAEWTAAGTYVNITGGTFSSIPTNMDALCAEGYIPMENTDGTYGVRKATYVAEYNGTKYESLQAAIDAASQRNGGQTEVTLLTDVTITETVVFAKMYSAGSVLLNLGGYTLTGKNCRALQINKGNLYLENGTVTSTGIVNSSSVIRIGSNEDAYSGISPMLYMRNSAKVLAPDSYGVTIFGSKTVSEKLTVAGNASIEATGPSPAISGNGDKAFHVDGKGTQITITGNAVVSATNNYAIYHPDNGTLNIQGNATISGKGGIQMCSGTLKIIGSPKIETLGKADHETGAAGPIYDIAAISAANRSYPGGAPVVTIKDTPTITTVDGENGEVIHAFSWDNTTKTESEWAEAGDCINVSGGTYNKTFNEAYLAEGCTLAAKDGMYTVEQTPVAEYNGTQYTSLAQAILDANKSGGTVKLLDNVTVTSSLGIGGTATVTLNLNKYTLTLDGAQIYTQGSANVTINNGTIKRIDEPTSGSASNFAIQVMSGSTLLLGGTQAIQKVVLESQYGIYNVGGLLNVRYANITTDGWSIAVNDSASKTGSVVIGSIGTANITSQNGNCIGTAVNSKPNVTISKGTLTSNGTAWDAGVIYWASEGTLTITGGTFKASSAEGSTAAAVYQKNGTVKISGTTATLLGNNALVVQAGDGSTGTMVTELSGGKYSTEPDKALVVEGKEVHEKDGLFVVEGEYVVEATLADGTIKSFDSWDKLASVWNETGATIKLLKDTSTAELVAPNGKLTIDFNGKTLTVTKASSSNANLEAAIVVQKGGELTLKDSVGNGGLTTTNVYGVEVITGSKLTIESGNYKCFTSAVQVDNGTAYIKGGTFQTEDTNKRYLLNCIDDAYQAGTAVMEVTGGTFYGFDPSAKPEGEGTTYVKVGYVVKKNESVYTVEKSTAEAQIVGTQTFGTLTDMLAQSANGQTVALVNDATVNNWYFAVAPGKTIDLNGNKLTVTGKLYSFGKVIDSTEGEGLLSVTDMAGSQLPKDNGYLPIKDGDGYRLYKYEFAAYGTKASDDKNSVMFAVQLEFTNLEAWDKIKADKNSVQLTYLAEWNGNKSIFSFKHSTLAGIAGKATAEKPTAYFTMTISGFNSLNLDGAEFKMTPQLECAFFTHSVDTQTYTIGG